MLVSSNDRLYKLLSIVEKENKELKEKLQEYKKDENRSEIRDATIHFYTQVRFLKKQNEELQNRNTELVLENRELKKEDDEWLKHKLFLYQNENKDLNEKIKQLNEELSRAFHINDNFHSKHNEIKELQKRNTELVLENRELINELPSPGCPDDNQIKTLQSVIQNLRQYNSQLKNINKHLFEEYNRLKKFIKENL